MPRWGSRKGSSKIKNKDLKDTITSPSELPPTVPEEQTEQEISDDNAKKKGYDSSAVAMAGSLQDEYNPSAGTSITKAFGTTINMIRSITADSGILDKGRYNVDETSKDLEVGRNDQDSTTKGTKSQDDGTETAPSPKLEQYWSRMNNASSVAGSRTTVDDKYKLIEEDGKSLDLPRNDAIKTSSSRRDNEEDTLSFEEWSSKYDRERRKDQDDDTWRSFTYSMDEISYAGDYDTVEVKQKYGYCAIGISIIQLFVIAVMMALCEVAPLEVNPMVGPYPDSFSYWGGKNAWLITQQFEIWRVATPVFLHTGVIHLFCNVAIQLETGAFFEREWGSGVWFLIYILSGIGSSVVSCIAAPNTISVGASGALMGLFGAKLGEIFMFSCFCVERIGGKPTHGLRMEQLSGVLCSVTILCAFSFIPYVDLFGNLGGFAVGFLVGICIFSWNIDGIFIKCLWATVGFFSMLCGLVYSIFYIYTEIEFNAELKDVCNYYRPLYHEGYECTCQNMFGNMEDYDDYY